MSLKVHDYRQKKKQINQQSKMFCFGEEFCFMIKVQIRSILTGCYIMLIILKADSLTKDRQFNI